MIKLWWHRLITKRVEMRFVNYSIMGALIMDGWEIAKEENENNVAGMVYVERRE